MTKQLTNQEIMTFCDQMYLILHSGISALEGISILRDDAVTREGREILDQMYQELELTGNLTEAMRQSGVFPDYVIHMTDLGEQTGELDNIFQSMARHYEREESIRREVRQAVTYPLIMIGIMAVVIVVLLTQVMPVFADVFEQLGTTMSGLSAGILQIGQTLNRYAVIFLAVLAAIVILVILCICTQKGRSICRQFFESFGPMRRISEKNACAHFADGMTLGIRAGLDTERSLELAEELIEQKEIQKKITDIRQRLEDGMNFPEAMEQTGMFSGMQARLVMIGARSGALDDVMERIADQYEEEINDQLQRTLSVLEPTLVAVLAVIVGVILLSVMLPLAGIMSGIA